jgi:hypothetical protein
MGETTALILTFVLMLCSTVAAWMGLALIGAEDGVFVAVILLIACAGSLAISQVVAHYAPPDEPKRRS